MREMLNAKANVIPHYGIYHSMLISYAHNEHHSEYYIIYFPTLYRIYISVLHPGFRIVVISSSFFFFFSSFNYNLFPSIWFTTILNTITACVKQNSSHTHAYAHTNSTDHTMWLQFTCTMHRLGEDNKTSHRANSFS